MCSSESPASNLTIQLNLDFGIKEQGKYCKKHPENNWRWVKNKTCIICTKETSLAYDKRARAKRRAAKLAVKRKKISSLFFIPPQSTDL